MGANIVRDIAARVGFRPRRVPFSDLLAHVETQARPSGDGAHRGGPDGIAGLRRSRIAGPNFNAERKALFGALGALDDPAFADLGALLARNRPAPTLRIALGIEEARRSGQADALAAQIKALLRRDPSSLHDVAKAFETAAALPSYRSALDAATGALLQIDAGRDVAESDEISGDLALIRIGSLYASERYAECLDLIGTLAPARRAAAFRYEVASLYKLGRYDRCEAVKAEARARLGEGAYVSALRELPRSVLTAADAADMLGGTDPERMDPQRMMHLIELLYNRGDLDGLQEVIDRLGREERFALQLAEMQAEARIANILEYAEIRRPHWDELLEVRSSLESAYARAAEGQPAHVTALLDQVARLKAGARQSWIESEYCFDHAFELAAHLRGRIAAGTPTSAIRIGDGEAVYLAAAGEGRPELEAARARMREIWWSDSRIGAGEADLEPLIRTAVRSADVVGIVPTWRILDRYRYVEERQKDYLGAFSASLDWMASDEGVAAEGLVLTSCHFHQAFMKWDLYKYVLAAAGEVSVVSCHDLTAAIPEMFGIGVRRSYLIPSESRFSQQFAAGPITEAFYPGRFRELVDGMEVEPGDVYLVAAGFLGKYLCHLVKERGGIAIDIGSGADYMAGHRTRVFNAGRHWVHLRPGLLDGRDLDGLPLEAATGHGGGPAGGDAHPSGPLSSDESRRRDVRPMLAAPPVRTGTAPARPPILLTWHPRCASGYISSVLSSCGVELGHERRGRDGICSWMLAVDDLNPPWGDPPPATGGYAAEWAYVRDFRSSVPSIALENCRARSYAFRRFHIWRTSGIDLDDHRGVLDRALASYVLWYEIVLDRPLGGVVRVEHVAEDLPPLLERLDGRSGSEADLVRRKLREGHKANDSAGKFDIEKPRFTEADWGAADEALLLRLERLAARIGYAAPS